MTAAGVAIAEGWRKFLLEGKAAENYWRPYMLDMGVTHRDHFLEQFLPALLYIKAAAILDDALDGLISSRALNKPRKYKDTLEGRIDFLGDQGILAELDRTELHRIRKRRNALAHQNDAWASWGELKDDQSRIHEVLQAFGLVDPPKTLEFYAERSAMKGSVEPGFALEQDYEYGIKEDGKVALQVKWTKRIGSD
jgi:hypothetical protein